MKTRILSLAACLAVASAANAAVTYDENGIGFVGKGDVQSLYDWNNSMLQEYADVVEFRLQSGGTATWKCSGVNPGGVSVTSTHSVESDAVGAAVNFDARKNRVGQVTGFILNGPLAGSTEFASVGECPPDSNWRVPRSLVPGSIVYEGSGEPMLQVSIDGLDWYDLPITE